MFKFAISWSDGSFMLFETAADAVRVAAMYRRLGSPCTSIKRMGLVIRYMDDCFFYSGHSRFMDISPDYAW